MKAKIWMLLALMAITMQAFAQGNGVKGRVTDMNQKPLMGAMVSAIMNGVVKGGTVTDANGNYKINALAAGRYDIKAVYRSFPEKTTQGILLNGRMVTVNFTLQANAQKHEVPVAEEKEYDKQEDIKAVALTESQGASATSRYTAPVYKGLGAKKDRAAAGSQGQVYYYAPAPVDNTYAAKPRYFNPSEESYKKNSENDFMNVKANPLSTMSVDVDRASYSNVRRFINEGQKPPADAVRIEEMVNYFDYNYPQPTSDAPIAIQTELVDCPWQQDHKILRVGMQARKLDTENLPASNLVFLIDVSGSMDEPNKLPLLVSGMKMLVNNLRAEDKVSIVVYAGSAGMVLPPTSGNRKTTIYNALDKLHAGGSTAGGAGIKLAYKVATDNFIRGGNNRVLLATDGDFNVGVNAENELEDLIVKEREKGVFLTCLGFGMGNYKDSKMELLADKGNGNYDYIDNIQEAQKTLVSEFGGTLHTVAKDVKAQIEFNPNAVQAYRLVGYENRLLNEEDFKDDKKDAGDMGSGHSVTILYEVIPTGIKSKFVRPVNDLKYQQVQKPYRYIGYHEELATIKFRYKKPDGNKSAEMVHTIDDNTVDAESASENTRFACSVAMFGMLLKNSKYKGESTYDMAATMANQSRSTDTEGYRAELVRLIRAMDDNDTRTSAR